MRSLLFATVLSWVSLSVATFKGFPSKIFGVNLGSWLLVEPWMLPQEWVDMGGQICSSCDTCIMSEFAFVKEYGQEYADAKFADHWYSWFTQNDVDQLVSLGINTVRLPVGFWLVEALVNRDVEYYPKGGLQHLRRGLKQLKDAGIRVIIDHHALPGVAAINQQFAGNCTSLPQFYTPYNYQRTLVWSAVMAVLSHVDPAFCGVVSIEAMNEPLMNATMTPGYGDFQKQFVQVIRLVEYALGIPLDSEISSPTALDFTLDFPASLVSHTNATNTTRIFSPQAYSAVLKAFPIILQIASELPWEDRFDLTPIGKAPLITMFMNIDWQYNSPANPADATIGPQYYDNHLYYSFGGVADANEEAYMISICNLKRLEDNVKLRNTPLIFGEWGLPTQFNATDEFLCQWADAQKYQYSRAAGWVFWNFKIEISEKANDTARQWSYFEGVKRGYLTEDPKELHDPHVCDPYFNKTYVPPKSTTTSGGGPSYSVSGSVSALFSTLPSATPSGSGSTLSGDSVPSTMSASPRSTPAPDMTMMSDAPTQSASKV